jgi:catechol 2,3-dioxygenase-like lactoylglutathione lyase family enzyme
MPTRYDHVCLTVGELDRSIAFYERYFGLKVVRRDAPHKGPVVECMTGVEGGELLAAFMTDGRFVLELIQFTAGQGERTSGSPANEVGSPHIGFACDDVRAIHAQWSAEGVRFHADPIVSRTRNTWSVMMADPDGITIELREGPALTPEQFALAEA